MIIALLQNSITTVQETKNKISPEFDDKEYHTQTCEPEDYTILCWNLPHYELVVLGGQNRTQITQQRKTNKKKEKTIDKIK